MCAGAASPCGRRSRKTLPSTTPWPGSPMMLNRPVVRAALRTTIVSDSRSRARESERLWDRGPTATDLDIVLIPCAGVLSLTGKVARAARAAPLYVRTAYVSIDRGDPIPRSSLARHCRGLVDAYSTLVDCIPHKREPITRVHRIQVPRRFARQPSSINEEKTVKSFFVLALTLVMITTASAETTTLRDANGEISARCFCGSLALQCIEAGPQGPDALSAALGPAKQPPRPSN